MKIVTIIATALLFLGGGSLLSDTTVPAYLPQASALWGLIGTTVLLYWPQDHPLLLLMKCWLCTVLYGSALAMLADCSILPYSAGLVFLHLLPLFMLLVPCIVFIGRHYSGKRATEWCRD